MQEFKTDAGLKMNILMYGLRAVCLSKSTICCLRMLRIWGLWPEEQTSLGSAGCDRRSQKICLAELLCHFFFQDLEGVLERAQQVGF